LQDNALRRTSIDFVKTLTGSPSLARRAEPLQSLGNFRRPVATGSITSFLMTEHLDVQVKQADCRCRSPRWQRETALSAGSDRGPIPLQLILESKNISLLPGAPKKWELTLSAHP